MDTKITPASREKLEQIATAFGTPYYLYDEAQIRENARKLNAAFSVFPVYLEHFAVKALPNPYILKILAEEGIGADCSSIAELVLCEKAGITGEQIMFTSNQTPRVDMEKALALGAVVNLDDITHIAFLEDIGGGKLPEILSFRYNPGPEKVGNSIIGNPVEAKYGLTRPQLFEAYKIARDKGVKRFGLHTMVASNELNIEYHKDTARMLFTLVKELQQQVGIALEFVNLGGGVGIPYKPEDVALEWDALARATKAIYDEVLGNAAPTLQIKTEYGRPITGPYGFLVARAIHEKHIYRDYIGLDACMADLMRPGLYGAHHTITVPGKEDAPLDHVYDVVGGLCENNDKFAIQRALPKIDVGDLVVLHQGGAHARAMGFNYNGKLRPQELLLRPDGTVVQIRRRETLDDYFATLDLDGLASFK